MIALLALWACGGDPEPGPTEPSSTVDSTPVGTPPATGSTGTPVDSTAPVPEPVCPAFAAPLVAGVVTDDTLVENSGLAWVDGMLWAHNDSGLALLYGLSPQGAVLQRVPVRGMVVFDWEDIAHLDGHLWLADIGDNLSVRQYVTLYEVPVPGPDAKEVTARGIQLSWPDGSRDAEALIADPVTGDLLVLSKEFDGDTRVGRVPDPAAAEGVLEEVARVRFGGDDGWGDGSLVTGADIAPDGTAVVIRGYIDTLVFPRIPGEPWQATFDRTPCDVDVMPEGQGEAVAWGPDGLWLLGEGSLPPLNHTPVSAARP